MRVQDRPTVAVIGAGFSGLLTALHLLGRADGPRVRLVERRGAFARGAAYASTSGAEAEPCAPLLNVRAANMSAFPDDPAHFVRWLSGEAAGATATSRAAVATATTCRPCCAPRRSVPRRGG